ncbi:MAG: hypothetical protein M3018_10865 [Actinomycetota bacterium]|nr:hypothetical protein [Actinomycetota bacterium]
MRTAALLLLGDQAANVGTGAALTLIIPLGLLILALAAWVLLWRRTSRR